MPAHVNKPTDDCVKFIDIEKESRQTRIRVIVRQKTAFIEGETVLVAIIDVIRPHDVPFIVYLVGGAVAGAGEVDVCVRAVFQHEGMIKSYGVPIDTHDRAGIIDARGSGAAGAGKTDRGKVPAAQAEPESSGCAHDHAKIVNAECSRLRRSRRRGDRMKDTVVYHEAVLAGLQVIVLAHNLPDIIDVIRFRAFGAREVEVCELSLEQKKSAIVRGAGGECAYNCALVVDPERRTGGGSRNG